MDSFNDFNFDNELDFETAYQMLSNIDSIIEEHDNNSNNGHNVVHDQLTHLNTPILPNSRIFNDVNPSSNHNDNISHSNNKTQISVNDSNTLHFNSQSIRSSSNNFEINLHTTSLDKSIIQPKKLLSNTNLISSFDSSLPSPMGLKEAVLDDHLDKPSNSNFNLLTNNLTTSTKSSDATINNTNIDNTFNHNSTQEPNHLIASIVNTGSTKEQSGNDNYQKIFHSNTEFQPTPTNENTLDKLMSTKPHNLHNQFIPRQKIHKQTASPLDKTKQSSDHDLLSSIESHAIEQFLDTLLFKDDVNTSLNNTTSITDGLNGTTSTTTNNNNNVPLMNLIQSPVSNIDDHKINNNNNHIHHKKNANSHTNSSVLLNSDKIIPKILHDIALSEAYNFNHNDNTTDNTTDNNTNSNGQLLLNKSVNKSSSTKNEETNNTILNQNDQDKSFQKHDDYYDKEYKPEPIELPDIKSHKIEPPKSIMNDNNAIKKWRHVEIEKIRRIYTRDKYDELSNLKRLKNQNTLFDNSGKRVSKHIVLNNIVNDIKDLLNANRKLEDLINNGL